MVGELGVDQGTDGAARGAWWATGMSLHGHHAIPNRSPPPIALTALPPMSGAELAESVDREWPRDAEVLQQSRSATDAGFVSEDPGAESPAPRCERRRGVQPRL